jgi:Protein of unknown function (DUF4232)
MPTISPVARLAIGGLLAGVLAGCAQTPPTGAGTATAGHQTRQAQAGSSSVPGLTTVPGLDGLAVCRSAALKVTVDTRQAGGATGSVYYPVDFTNTSGGACGLYGYPGMSFVTSGGSAGRQIGAAAQHDTAFDGLPVRLPAKGMAHAWLQVAEAANYPASACQPTTAHWLRVFPPGDTAASYVKVSLGACASASTPLLTVEPIRSGGGVQGVTP